MGFKGLFGLISVVLITLGVGLLLIPLLIHYPASAILMVAVGLYFSNYLTINMGKGLVGALLTVGFTLISAAGLVSYSLAVGVITALVLGIGLAIVCQWMVYPWFPEDVTPVKKAKPPANTANMNAQLPTDSTAPPLSAWPEVQPRARRAP